MYSKPIKNRFPPSFLRTWGALFSICHVTNCTTRHIREGCPLSDNRIRLRWKAIRYTVVHVLELKQKNCIMGIKRKFSQPTQYYAKKRPVIKETLKNFKWKWLLSYISADISIQNWHTLKSTGLIFYWMWKIRRDKLPHSLGENCSEIL